MFRPARLLVAIALSGMTVAAQGKRRLVKIASVIDGDTVVVRTASGRAVKTHLAGIDAPEKGQPYADVAVKELRKLAEAGVELGIESVGKAEDGLPLANLYGNDTLVNAVLVGVGGAWYDGTEHAEKSKLAGFQQVARKHRDGLWTDPNPVPPWEWRKSHGIKGGTQPGPNIVKEKAWEWPKGVRIGETPEECEKRYGKPTETDERNPAIEYRTYEKNGFRIKVGFVRDKANAQRAGYLRYSKPGGLLGLALGDEVVATLLKSNGGEHEWEKAPWSTAMEQSWRNRDLGLYANHSSVGDDYLSITSPPYTEALKEREKAKAEGL